MTHTTTEATDPTLTIHSDATAALAEAQQKLERLDAGSKRREQAALDGKLDAVDLANHRDRVDLARAVVAAAQRAVEVERARISSPAELRVAIDQFLADPDLTTQPVVDALNAAKAAAVAADTVITNRNQRLIEWRDRFTALGVPASGLTLGQDEIRLRNFGAAIAVEISGQSAKTTENGRKIVADAIAHRDELTQAAAFARDDTRAVEVQHAEVRLLRETGGQPEGTVLSTRSGRTAATLRTLVSYGAAELISGELPDPSVSDERAASTRDAHADRLASASEYQVPRQQDWI
ncbi:hypothetical protein ITJ58_18785 [Curtobacterium flaccumfaciens]|uniref:hypothetical protein n=1 Tax=Curtobacterium flaccumfaciens TaxID=2035 RepID=UPI001889C58A|nr:hypothetical protein [Curtobacterium flaccumfaciens]MBF4595806.1 hypothetical protein [Curtobacterium flaccumfaciens]